MSDRTAHRSDTVVADELAQKFETEKDTPYLRWVRGEGLDIITAHYVPQPAHRRAEAMGAPRRQRGVFINHEASRTSNDCYVCEIPPGRKLAPHRQLFEEMVFILNGRGSTTVWNNAGQRITFEWKAGAIFGIPLNCWHQHFNGSGQEPARYVAVTNSPPVINLYEDVDFVFNSKRDFKSRFTGEPDYFAAARSEQEGALDTNFIADAVNLPLSIAEERGAGGGHIRFNWPRARCPATSRNSRSAPTRRRMRHGPGAHVIILTGEGYSLMWPDGERADPLRLAGRHADRAAERDGSTSISTPGRRRRAISPSSTWLAAQFARRADVLDQPAARRRPARLCRRDPGGAEDVRRGARPPRPDAADGGILPQGARNAAAGGGVSSGRIIAAGKCP